MMSRGRRGRAVRTSRRRGGIWRVVRRGGEGRLSLGLCSLHTHTIPLRVMDIFYFTLPFLSLQKNRFTLHSFPFLGFGFGLCNLEYITRILQARFREGKCYSPQAPRLRMMYSRHGEAPTARFRRWLATGGRARKFNDESLLQPFFLLDFARTTCTSTVASSTASATPLHASTPAPNSPPFAHRAAPTSNVPSPLPLLPPV